MAAADGYKLADAYRLMTAPLRAKRSLWKRNPRACANAMWMNRFGQCRLARAPLWSGVRFVTVNTFITVFNEITWDIHGSKPFTSIERHARSRGADV